MKKKCAAIILVLTMLAASLIGCGSSKPSDPAEGAAGSEIQPADSEEVGNCETNVKLDAQ